MAQETIRRRTVEVIQSMTSIPEDALQSLQAAVSEAQELPAMRAFQETAQSDYITRVVNGGLSVLNWISGWIREGIQLVERNWKGLLVFCIIVGILLAIINFGPVILANMTYAFDAVWASVYPFLQSLGATMSGFIRWIQDTYRCYGPRQLAIMININNSPLPEPRTDFNRASNDHDIHGSRSQMITAFPSTRTHSDNAQIQRRLPAATSTNHHLPHLPS